GLLCSVMLATTLVIHAIRERQYWRSILLPTGIGFFAGLACLALVLTSCGALGPFIQQVFLDAGAKKNIGLTKTILEFATGGKYTLGEMPIWLILYHAMTFFPLLVAIYLQRHAEKHLARFRLPWAQLGASIPVALALLGLCLPFWGVFHAYDPKWEAFLIYDVPRVFFSVFAAYNLWPTRFENNFFSRVFAIPALQFVLIVPVILAYAWAYQLSWGGRLYLSVGWGAPNEFMGVGINLMLVFGILLLFFMSDRLSARTKLITAICFLGISLLFFAQDYSNGFRNRANPEGGFAANTETIDHPMLRGMRVSKQKAFVFDKLRAFMRPGDSAFFYGQSPVLYTLLGSKSLTHLEVAHTDFYSTQDAKAAASRLRANPPRWVIRTDISVPGMFDSFDKYYDPKSPLLNMVHPRILHQAIRDISPRYTLVFDARKNVNLQKSDRLPDHDHVLSFLLYQRRD
ncbi:MAG: hypothetical protein V1754_13805, partial [Pseudomonadota bacterium]